MTSPRFCAPGDWAHHSWLDDGRPLRDERAARAAHASLFGRYPQLTRLSSTADVPPMLPGWPRPACARLCRVVAALGFANAMRRVVTADSRAAFAAGVAPHLLAAIQRHPRAADADLCIAPGVSLDSRFGMTAFGLAVAIRAAAHDGHAFWWRLRLPRAVSDAAAVYRIDGLPVQVARALVTDAMRLMGSLPC
ncbi:hypothetical protein [Paraburkholderia sp.]|uniref:hypothetical protein n=1 Tax=Paraburkholderia sp. TaxID=1926495 RepID=UPI00238E7CA1|nr:hypothetical protein [Paraburkholderia sp.]MDE1184509.1 hypothetical protein [Paraburkholderia sp.]